MTKKTIILIVLLIMGCSKKQAVESSAITIMVDQTDTTINGISMAEIMKELKPDQNLWNATSLRYRTIQHTDYTNIIKSEIAEGDPESKTEEQRRKEFRKFIDPITQALKNNTTKKIALSESIIFRPIIDELHHLVKSKASRKKLIIYSDLLENSTDFSIYRNDQVLYKNSIIAQLTKDLVIPDLTGITIEIIHTPKPGKTNMLFRQMVKVYTEILEHHGASVSVTGGGSI